MIYDYGTAIWQMSIVAWRWLHGGCCEAVVVWWLLCVIIGKLMQDFREEVRGLLQLMQSQQVAEAELKLSGYSGREDYLHVVIDIMREEKQYEWLRTVAASVLNKNLLEWVGEQTLRVSQIVRQVLFDEMIKPIDKRCLEKAIIEMLSVGGQEIHKQWQRAIVELLQSKPNFDSAYLVLACFAVAEEVPYQIIRGMLQVSFDPILTSLEVSLDNSYLLNEMLKMWIVLFDSLRREDENAETLCFMANSQKLMDLLDLIYEFHSVEGIIVCLNPELFELNLLKYQAAELNKRMLMFVSETQSKCRTLEEYSRKNFTKFARTLHAMSLQQSLIEAMSCEDLLTTLVTVQRLYLSLHPQEFTLETAVSLLQNEVFPFLPADDEQRVKFQDSAEEFNSLAEDCCDKQTYGIMKTQSFKFMETIGDAVDGCFKYVLNRAIESIKVSLGFVTYTMEQSAVLPVETAFLVLSAFSYGISHYPEQREALKVILCDERIRQLAPLQTSRVFTFLAYNYNEIYSQPKDGDTWISFALTYRAHPTTAYLALDFLSNTVEDYFNQYFLEALINEIPKCRIAVIWEITTKVIEAHFQKFSAQGILHLIGKLFQRIQLEVGMLESKQKEHTLDLVQCLSVFSVVLEAIQEEDRQVNQNRHNSILEGIWPITEFYRAALQWNLEDEIVKIVINILNVLPAIVPNLYPLVSQFKTLFKANGYYEKVYLWFFNQFILKADFTRDQQAMIEVVIVLKEALQSSVVKVGMAETGKYKGSQGERVTAGNVLIVVQNLLAVHGNNLLQSNSLDFFNEIGALCLQLLPNIDQQAEKSSSGRIIMSRALNTLFLCHLHVKTDCFYNYLNRLKGQNLYHGYDTRVFLQCVAMEVFRETDFTAIANFIDALLQIVGKSQEKKQNLEKKKKGKATLKIQTQIKKIGDMDKILKKIKTPFSQEKSIGEEVIDLFTRMHEGNPNMVKDITATLLQDSMTVLCRYVDLQNLGKRKRVIRKVVGIKEGPNPMAMEQLQAAKKARKMQDECESQDQTGPKRLRTKIKLQGKKKTTTRKITPH